MDLSCCHHISVYLIGHSFDFKISQDVWSHLSLSYSVSTYHFVLSVYNLRWELEEVGKNFKPIWWVRWWDEKFEAGKSAG